MYTATELMKKMIQSFSDQLNTFPTFFLSNLFGKNPSEISVSDSEVVEIDIERFDEKIAVDVTRGGEGNLNTYGKYSTKLYAPPLYNEYTNLAASQLTKRLPGQSPYETVNKQANAISILFKSQFEVAKKIMRAMELQASQALFTGKIVFKNADTMDFKRKDTHNITPTISWDADAADPLKDLDLACKVNRIDGKVVSNIAIFGGDAWDAFLRNSKVLDLLKNRRIELGVISPTYDPKSGAVYQGTIKTGNYQLELYTYDQYYKDANNNVKTYVPSKQVLVLDSKARLNKSYGAVDILMEAEAAYRALNIPVIPMTFPGTLVQYSYAERESNLIVGVKSAPILIPTQIDAIANINVLA
jgi:hypothetical protein